MAIEKQKKLRKIEFIFTDGEVNPVCHCEYVVEILEDGQRISRSKHRENMNVSNAKAMIQDAKIRKEDDFLI